MADDVDPPRKPKATPKAGDSKPEGWIDGLARRSTGLPGDETPAPKDREGDKKLWSVFGLGIQFAATVALFALMGYELDKKMNWAPWGLVTLSLLAVIGNLYLLIKESLKEDRPGKRKK